MKRMLIVIMLAACGGSSETPVEEITYGDDTVVEGRTDDDKVRSVVGAQVAALETGDADAFLATQALDDDSFMLGPVDVAVMEGAAALDATVRRVMGGMPRASVEAREHRLEVVGDAAYTAHEMTLSAENETVTYRAVQTLRKMSDAWRVVASAWTLAVPDERAQQMAMAGALSASSPITERVDTGCEHVAADMRAWRDEARMPAAEHAVGGFSFGSAPGEAGPFTQELYDGLVASVEAGQVRPAAGPGGVRAQRVGDLCFAATAIDYTFGESTFPMRAVIVASTEVPYPIASFSIVLPRGAEPEPAEPSESAETQSSP